MKHLSKTRALGLMTGLSMSLLLTSVFVACSGGDGSSSAGGSDAANSDCSGSCVNQSLSTEDVNGILRQAITATRELGTAGTFAVTDRVGNVLALYQMTGAPGTTRIDGQVGAKGTLEGLSVPATLAAISKAGTGAYLSSQGNAFSTRTASQIVQENFDPQETNKPGGPLFGVQFSQLLCGDVTVLNPAFAAGVSAPGKTLSAGSVGPRALPLGLSADPGGIPLYKNGDMVGGLGVEFDGAYSVDRSVIDFDDDPEERVALSASLGFEAPSQRIAENIFVGGRSLRYTDLSYGDLAPLPDSLEQLEPAGLKSELFYSDGTIKAGSVFGDPRSGIAKSVRAGIPVAYLVDDSGANRVPIRTGRALPGNIELTPIEVDALLDSAVLTANRARAAIRTPRDSQARVSVWVVDDLGNPLGFVRSEDAPIFGIDVSLQKARVAAFFSSTDAGQVLSAAFGSTDADYAGNFSRLSGLQLDGGKAFTNRAVGNLSRPFFVDGINGNPHGPFSLPFPGTSSGRTWSPFNTGLQLDVALGGLAAPLGIPTSPPTVIPNGCANSLAFGNRLKNGIQIFPGSVPLYRNGVLVGALGVSGDGIDQDDMTSFLGASRKGLDFAGHPDIGDSELGFQAPIRMRADTITFAEPDARLRYVSCPEGPFVRDNDQNVCEGF